MDSERKRWEKQLMQRLQEKGHQEEQEEELRRGRGRIAKVLVAFLPRPGSGVDEDHLVLVPRDKLNLTLVQGFAVTVHKVGGDGRS
jgi:hypothetical protein